MRVALREGPTLANAIGALIQEPDRVNPIDRISPGVRIPVPASRVCRTAAGHVRVRRHESSGTRIVKAIHRVIEAGIGIPEIARKLLGPVLRGRGLLLSPRIELSDRPQAVRSRIARCALDQLPSEIIVRAGNGDRRARSRLRECVRRQLLPGDAPEGDLVRAVFVPPNAPG